jgi:hypothetical protein
MSTDLMIDIETLGTKPNGHILSVGMCWFSRDNPSEPIDKLEILYPELGQPKSCIDINTVTWWMKQGSAAQAVFHIPDGLRSSNEQVAVKVMENTTNAARIWAKDPDFDCVMLNSFVNNYRGWRCEYDWPFWKNRSVRTILDMCPVAKQLPFGGTQHDALADAVFQAQQMQAYFKTLRN